MSLPSEKASNFPQSNQADWQEVNTRSKRVIRQNRTVRQNSQNMESKPRVQRRPVQRPIRRSNIPDEIRELYNPDLPENIELRRIYEFLLKLPNVMPDLVTNGWVKTNYVNRLEDFTEEFLDLVRANVNCELNSMFNYFDLLSLDPIRLNAAPLEANVKEMFFGMIGDSKFSLNSDDYPILDTILFSDETPRQSASMVRLSALLGDRSAKGEYKYANSMICLRDTRASKSHYCSIVKMINYINSKNMLIFDYEEFDDDSKIKPKNCNQLKRIRNSGKKDGSDEILYCDDIKVNDPTVEDPFFYYTEMAIIAYIKFLMQNPNEVNSILTENRRESISRNHNPQYSRERTNQNVRENQNTQSGRGRQRLDRTNSERPNYQSERPNYQSERRSDFSKSREQRSEVLNDSLLFPGADNFTNNSRFNMDKKLQNSEDVFAVENFNDEPLINRGDNVSNIVSNLDEFIIPENTGENIFEEEF